MDENWTIKKAECWRIDAFELWCWRRLLRVPCIAIKPVHPKGNQSWIFIGRTDAEAPVLWPPDVKIRLIRKDPDAGKDCRQEEKGTTEDEMVGWHRWLNGHGFEQAPGDGERQESLMCRSPWSRKELDTTEQLSNSCLTLHQTRLFSGYFSNVPMRLFRLQVLWNFYATCLEHSSWMFTTGSLNQSRLSSNSALSESLPFSSFLGSIHPCHNSQSPYCASLSEHLEHLNLPLFLVSLIKARSLWLMCNPRTQTRAGHGIDTQFLFAEWKNQVPSLISPFSHLSLLCVSPF